MINFKLDLKFNLIIDEYHEELINKIDIRTEKLLCLVHTDDTQKARLNLIRELFIVALKDYKELNFNFISKNSNEIHNRIWHVYKSTKSEELINENVYGIANQFFCYLVDGFKNDLELKSDQNNFSSIGMDLVITDFYIDQNDFSENENTNLCFKFTDLIKHFIFKFKNEKSSNALVLKIFKSLHKNEPVLRHKSDEYISNIKKESKSEVISVYLIGIKKMDLHSNSIKNLDLPFEYFKNLEEINLSDNEIENLQEYLFCNLTRLKKLYLSKNKIKLIKNNLFENLNNLAELHLNNNSIKLIQPFAFKNLLNLKILELQENQLTIINKNSFHGLIRLENLNLYNNHIQKIDNNSFKNLFKLNKLILSDNDVSSITEQAFEDLNNLEELYLNNNNIEKLQANTFFKLKNLKVLALDLNYLYYINQYYFSGLVNLVNLDIASNSIKYIEPCSFKDLKSLKKLTIGNYDFNDTYNNVNLFDTNLFYGLNSLEELNLENHQLNTIKPLFDLPNIKILNLKTWDRFKSKFYMKKITSIENLAFFNLNNIEKLDLSYNDIDFIKANTFKGLNNLKILNLSFNKINKIDRAAFKELNSLEKLDLSFNNLKFIPKNSFSALNNIKELNLIGNVGLMGAAKAYKSKEDFEKICQSNKFISIFNTLYNSIF